MKRRKIVEPTEYRSTSALWSKGRNREIVLVLEAGLRRIGLRLKGEKRTVYLPTGAAYALAAQLEHETKGRRR